MAKGKKAAQGGSKRRAPAAEEAKRLAAETEEKEGKEDDEDAKPSKRSDELRAAVGLSAGSGQKWGKNLRGCLDEERPLQKKPRLKRDKQSLADKPYIRAVEAVKKLDQKQRLLLFLNYTSDDAQDSLFQLARAKLSESQIAKLAEDRLDSDEISKLVPSQASVKLEIKAEASMEMKSEIEAECACDSRGTCDACSGEANREYAPPV